MRRSCAKSSGRPGNCGGVVGAQAVEDDAHEALAQHRLQLARDRGGVRDAGEQHRHVGRADVGADRAGGLRPRDELGDRAHNLLAWRRGRRRTCSRSPSGRRARGGGPGKRAAPRRSVRTRVPDRDRRPPLPPRPASDSYIAPTTASTSACLVGKLRHTVPTPDPGPAGDLFDRRLHARLREHGLGRGEHPLAVAPGIGAPGPVARDRGFSSGSMIPIIVGFRKRRFHFPPLAPKFAPRNPPRSHHGSRDQERGRCSRSTAAGGRSPSSA